MSDERQILNYATRPETPGVPRGLRLIGACVCVLGALVGLGIVGVGALSFIEMLVFPDIAKPEHICGISAIFLFGLLITAFSVRWFVKATRPNRKARG